MAKKKTTKNKSEEQIKKEDVFKSIKNFCQIGARIESPGNIPTGHFILDFIIQKGENPNSIDLNSVEGYDPTKTLGIPLGKLVEIFGEEGGGKSSLAYRICGYAQKLGHVAMWVDVENSFQKNLAYVNGCDIDELCLFTPINKQNPDKFYFGEDIIDRMIEAMEAGVGVIVLDSVANLVPKALMEAKTEQDFMGLLPRLLSKTLGKLASYAEKNGTLLVFINQLREKIGTAMYQDPRTSPGGHSLHHNASLRIRIDKRNTQKADIHVPHPETGQDMIIGRHSRATIIKNKFAPPYRESIDLPIYYAPYFPDIEEIAFNTGRQIKLISVYKEIYNWDGLKIEGRKQFIDHIVKEGLTDSLINAIKEKAVEEDFIVPPEIAIYEPKNDKSEKTKKE